MLATLASRIKAISGGMLRATGQ